MQRQVCGPGSGTSSAARVWPACNISAVALFPTEMDAMSDEYLAAQLKLSVQDLRRYTTFAFWGQNRGAHSR